MSRKRLARTSFYEQILAQCHKNDTLIAKGRIQNKIRVRMIVPKHIHSNLTYNMTVYLQSTLS